MTPETPDPPPEGVTLSGHFLVSASEIAELAQLRTTIAACKDRFQRILDEPNNTMSDRKAMREIMRQANLGLSACAAIDKARGK